jgi:hypothetical protein
MAEFGAGGASIKFVPTLEQSFKKLGLTASEQEKIFRWSVMSVTAYALREIQKAFNVSQSQPGGSAWKGVSQEWAEKKTDMGKSAKIGTFMGRLSGSFTGPSDPRTVTGADAVDVDRVQHIGRVGTEILYGGYFNEGTKFTDGRPFIPTGSHITSHWRRLHARLLEHPELVPNV